MGGVEAKAVEQATQVLVAADPSPPPGLPGAAEALAAEILFGCPTSVQVAAATRETATALTLTALEASLLLQRLVVRDPLFLRVEPVVAIDGQLRSLLLFAPLTHASLWLGGGTAPPVCAASMGVTQPRRPVRTAAIQALEGTANASSSRGSGGVRSLAVRTDAGRAVLVVRTRRGKTRAGLAHASETATALVPVLERQCLLDHMLHSTAEVLAAVDRRVLRFGFDLHDGPLQRLSLLAGELALLNRQLGLLVSDDGARVIAERRVTDLAEMAIEVTRELREFARSAGGPRTEPLASQLGRAAREFEGRAGIPVDLTIEGEIDRTTDSQRIAVARVVEEALANVREHSRAAAVHILLFRDPDRLRLIIEDDGKGFDVARALSRAARAGRLGLGSMHERVRMLGGQLEITSRRGGPTVVAASLPAWDTPERSLSAALATRLREAR